VSAHFQLSARILVYEQLCWISQEANPVLTQCNPVDGVDIIVRMVPAAAGSLTDKEWTL
jgi:hypothetical protein